MQKISKAYQRWLDNIDNEETMAAIHVRQWPISLVSVAVTLLLLTQIQTAQQFTGLSLIPSFMCFIPVFIIGISTASLKNRIERPLLGVMLTLTCGCMFFWCAVITAMAAPKSKFIFATLFMLCAFVYGQTYRVAAKEPFIIIAMLSAIAVALLINSSAATVTAMILLGTMSPIIAITSGGWQLAVDKQRKEREQLRNAVLAQMHQEQASQLQELQSSMIEILASNHDLNNILQAIALNTGMLRGKGASMFDPEEVSEIIEDVYQGALQTRALSQTIRNKGKELRSNYESMAQVEIEPVLRKIITGLQGSFPRVEFVLDVALENAAASVAKGEDTLKRILDNLLRNACEGDGKRSATKIDVTLARHRNHDAVTIEIVDNGPGFTQEYLAQNHAKPFATTKKEGTGLGLYIVEKWLTASGGRLTRGNREDTQGAQVLIELPVWI